MLIAFDDVIGVDGLTDAQHLVVRQFVHAALEGNAELGAQILRLGATDAMNVGKGDFHTLLRRNVHASNTSHETCSLNNRQGLNISPDFRHDKRYGSCATEGADYTSLRSGVNQYHHLITASI